MSNERAKALLAVIRKLEDATEQILRTQGYIEDVAKQRVLIELLKEQVGNEDTRNSTRTIR